MAKDQDLPTPTQILKRFYAAEAIYMSTPLEQRDFSIMGKHLSPEVRLYQSPDLPYGGEYKGHAGWLQCFELMGRYYSALDVVNPQVYEGEDGIVVMRRDTGREWREPLSQLVRVDRAKGVITSMRPFYWNVAGLRKVIGV
ncbi:hypothetical protein LTR56_018160 [Elasticomyces elasticus]|nr:hypothetical protein LTR22_024847 [Elasticomyces elasticus]KAK3629273.1 hypothetical protein LTR56_018160 [Elasticomyces elasticus]KAK5742555.1 hypothetical protein LTS12_024186 [Elasticomyces elasticus]